MPSNALTPYRPGRRDIAQGAAFTGIVSAIASEIIKRAPGMKKSGELAREFYSGLSTKGSSHPLKSARTIEAAPVTLGTVIRSSRAKISTKRKGSTVITHRELVEPGLMGSTGYSLQAEYALNPGLKSTFPWLSVQAAQYQEYKFLKLSFDYVPIAATSSQGDITLCVDYEASNAPPTREVEASDLPGSVTGSIWRPFSINLPIKDLHPSGKKYIRSGNQYGDVKTYDAGNFFVCSENSISGLPVGKLYVNYSVELSCPYNGPSQSLFPAATSFYTLASTQALTSGTAAKVNFDTLGANALNIISNGAGRFYLPNGYYRFEATVSILDSMNEKLTIVLQGFKNGGLIPGSFTGYSSTLTGSTNGYVQVSVFGFVSITNSNAPSAPDFFELMATAVGTGGTLGVASTNAMLAFSLA